MINRLLNNSEFNISEYIEKQETILSSGFYFKILYKKSLKNLNSNIFSSIFHKNFITISPLIDYKDLIKGISKFSQVEQNYRNNPMVIDGSSKVKIYVQESMVNPKIKNLVVDEFPHQGKLIYTFGGMLNPDPGQFSILGSESDLKVFDEQKYFYIHITDLKMPDLPGDFDELMKEVEQEFLQKIKDIVRDKIPAMKYSPDNYSVLSSKKNSNQFAKEVEKLTDLLKIRFCGFNEVISYKTFIHKIYYSINSWGLQNKKRPLNLKKMIDQSVKSSEYYKQISPVNELKYYRLTKSMGNFGLSKIKS